MDWGKVFLPDTAPLEIFLRGTTVYLAVFFLLRVVFKRESGTTGITDLIVIVFLADAAQNAMSGSYSSVLDGLLLVATLVFWSAVLNFAAYRLPWFERLVKPGPLVLVRNGRMFEQNMAKELMTRTELYSQLRQHGARRLRDVELATMESDGRLAVILREQQQDTAEPERVVT